MVNSGLLLLVIILAFLMSIVIINRFFNQKILKFLDWFIVSLTVFNGIGFVFVLCATLAGRNSISWSQYINQFDNETVILYIMSSVILGLGAVFGWIFTDKITPSVKNKKNQDVDSLIQYLRKAKQVAWIMFFLGVFFYWLYSRAYGGFIGLLGNSFAIRSGIARVSNPLSFFQRFGGFSFFSSYLFFGLLLDRYVSRSRKKECLIGFVMSFLFSIYVLYSWAGRVMLLTYMTTFVLSYLLYKYTSKVKLVRKLVVVAICLPIALMGIGNWLGRTHGEYSIVELFARELSFPYASYIVQLKKGEYRFFKDIAIAPLYLLPQRIWSQKLNIESASSFNTFVFSGARKGVAGVTGEVPVDLLTFAYMQASVIGVVVVGFLWGSILLKLERICLKIEADGIRMVMYALFVLDICVLTVLYGDPQHVIVRNFHMIVGFLFLTLVRHASFGCRTG